MLRIMVTPRMPSGAGKLGCSTEPCAQDHLVDHALDAGVEQAREPSPEKVGAEHHRRHRRAHQEVDRPRHLVVALARVERDALGRDVEAIAQADGPVPWPSLSTRSVKRCSPSRQQRAQLRAQLALGLVDQRARRRRRPWRGRSARTARPGAARRAGSRPSRRACRPSPSRGSASCGRTGAAARRRSRLRARRAPAAR